MLGVKKVQRRRGDGAGVCWPDSGTHEPSAIRDVFGPRPFSYHVATVGYDYDFHRGVDVVLDEGDPLYAPACGSVVRKSSTHFGFEASSQLAELTEVDSQSAAAFAIQGATSLRVTGSRVGALTFPTQIAYLTHDVERVILATSDWEVRVKFTSAPSISGGRVGCGVYDSVNDQWVAIEYDGSTFTCRGKDAGGVMAANGTTSAQAAKTWMRVRFDLAAARVYWDWSTDGETWTNIANEGTLTWTDGTRPSALPILYWISTDTNASAQTCDVDFWGWYDDQGIGRFGNWVQIGRAGSKFLLMHMREVVVNLGDIVQAGQQVGTAGKTGFDARSGNIIAPHVHLEYCPDNGYFYTNDDPENPLRAGILPRTNVSNNVSVTRTTANDPDGVASWKLAITVTRGDQDFDLNAITLTGDLASRTINWDTRSGLNADTDIPKQSGVYIVAADFDEANASYTVDVYFNKSVVGTTFVSASVADSTGTTLWSE